MLRSVLHPLELECSDQRTHALITAHIHFDDCTMQRVSVQVSKGGTIVRCQCSVTSVCTPAVVFSSAATRHRHTRVRGTTAWSNNVAARPLGTRHNVTPMSQLAPRDLGAMSQPAISFSTTSAPPPHSPFVDVAWVNSNLDKVIPIDGSWYMPHEQRDTEAEYQREHIPNARWFGIDECKDKSSSLPHMFPSPAEFEQYAGQKLGITQDDTLVLYDTSGLFSVARVYWTLKTFGHKGQIHILTGGLPAYKAAGYELTADPTRIMLTQYKSNFQPQLVKDLDFIKDNLQSNQVIVIDARPRGRFDGTAPEPRAGLKSGHMPHSISIPAMDLTAKGEEGRLTYKSAKGIEEIVRAAGVDVDAARSGKQKLVTSCGSGVTASTVALGLQLIGIDNVPVYDGSWTEYAQQNLPIETSADATS